jgi:hypothetical protein
MYASSILRNGPGYQVPDPSSADNPRGLRLPSRPSPSLPLPSQPSSPFYLCTRPSTPSTYDSSIFAGLDLRGTYTDMVSMVVERKPHFIFSPILSKALIKNNIPVPTHNLFQKQKPQKQVRIQNPPKNPSRSAVAFHHLAMTLLMFPLLHSSRSTIRSNANGEILARMILTPTTFQ